MASQSWTQSPKVDVSVIQLVGPQTRREEFKSLYYEVYKLWRLPGSPLGEPKWMEELMVEVMSSLGEYLGQKGGKAPQTTDETGSSNIWPPKSKTPRRGRRDTSMERAFAKAREAHQRALATTANMEEEIEWLSQSITRG